MKYKLLKAGIIASELSTGKLGLDQFQPVGNLPVEWGGAAGAHFIPKFPRTKRRLRENMAIVHVEDNNNTTRVFFAPRPRPFPAADPLLRGLRRRAPDGAQATAW